MGSSPNRLLAVTKASHGSSDRPGMTAAPADGRVSLHALSPLLVLLLQERRVTLWVRAQPNHEKGVLLPKKTQSPVLAG